MTYKAIIFDMDGTIIDTTHIWRQVNESIFITRDIKVSSEVREELHLAMQGATMRQCCVLLKDRLSLAETVEELMTEKTTLAYSLYTQGVRFIEGFVSFHAQLQHHSLKSGVATNADAHTVHLTNEALQLTTYFGEHIYNLSHVNNVGKPDPALYLHAARSLDIDPRHCIAIEDSAHGIKAAKRAGMFCIGINTAGEKSLLCEADLVVDSYGDIDLKALGALVVQEKKVA